jgi:hypothetical protein
MTSYDDEIDLYGDAEVDAQAAAAEGAAASASGKVKQDEDSKSNVNTGSNNNNNSSSAYTSIPTFISEARGGTGRIPPRDDSNQFGSQFQVGSGSSSSTGQQQGNAGNDGAGGTDGRSGSSGPSGNNSFEGIIPKAGDYGQPGQWKTKPISSVRPSDMPEEGLVSALVLYALSLPSLSFPLYHLLPPLPFLPCLPPPAFTFLAPPPTPQHPVGVHLPEQACRQWLQGCRPLCAR